MKDNATGKPRESATGEASPSVPQSTSMQHDFVGDGQDYLLYDKRSLYDGPNASMIWWRPKQAGYTANLHKAGLYSREEAADIVRGHEHVVGVIRLADALARAEHWALVSWDHFHKKPEADGLRESSYGMPSETSANADSEGSR